MSLRRPKHGSSGYHRHSVQNAPKWLSTSNSLQRGDLTHCLLVPGCLQWNLRTRANFRNCPPAWVNFESWILIPKQRLRKQTALCRSEFPAEGCTENQEYLSPYQRCSTIWVVCGWLPFGIHLSHTENSVNLANFIPRKHQTRAPIY